MKTSNPQIIVSKRDTPAKAALSGAFAGGVSVLLFQGIDVGKNLC
jgi:hypothetical protein